MNKNYIYIIIGIVLILVLFQKRKKIAKVMSNIPRGIRNNNFGNIIKTKTFWKGEIQGNDTRFKTFSTPAYGYRAMFLLLEGYLKQGLNTIEKIISKYAPSNENDTKGYINSVSKRTNLQIDEALTSNDLPKLIEAISYIENGKQPILADIEQGKKLYYNV